MQSRCRRRGQSSGLVIPPPVSSLTPHMAGTFVFRWALFAWVVLCAGPLRALEIQRTLWGYDGHVVPNCFNPLSVLVANPGDAAFAGTLTLSNGGGGADLVQPLALPPHSSHWVQFYVLTENQASSPVLRWGRGEKERRELDGPAATGPPACVWLREKERSLTVSDTLEILSRRASFPDNRRGGGGARCRCARSHAPLGPRGPRRVPRLGEARRHRAPRHGRRWPDPGFWRGSRGAR